MHIVRESVYVLRVRETRREHHKNDTRMLLNAYHELRKDVRKGAGREWKGEGGRGGPVQEPNAGVVLSFGNGGWVITSADYHFSPPMTS